MEENKGNAAKFAFFYLLSLVGLIFVSISVGTIIFEIINKFIDDPAGYYGGAFNDQAVKFAISAIFVAGPIFYVVTSFIYKSLYKGELDKDSGVRRWLTYFILFVSSVVMIGWLIGVINNFLNGEITLKFVLKALTSLMIASGIFSFYLYDIRREDIHQKKDKVIKVFFYVSLVIVSSVFIASFFMIDSPKKANEKKIDRRIINNFRQVDTCVEEYHRNNDKLPENMASIKQECNYILDDELKDPETGDMFEYKIVGDGEYELCAEFRTSNIEEGSDHPYSFDRKEDLHASGWQCLKREVYEEKKEQAPDIEPALES